MQGCTSRINSLCRFLTAIFVALPLQRLALASVLPFSPRPQTTNFLIPAIDDGTQSKVPPPAAIWWRGDR